MVSGVEPLNIRDRQICWKKGNLLNKSMHISEFQQLISKKYEKRDRQRGVPRTFLWFIEEVGELATALAQKSQQNKNEEFADVFAWLCTLANISDVDLEKACAKYTGSKVKGFKPK
jgi:NTP pyrophosphatase (non-canonical NTP hydrolase)